MDWLESHESILDCKNKKLYFIDDIGYKRVLVRMNRRVSIRFISLLHLKKSMRNMCNLYVVMVLNKKEDTMSIE
jgi:hypothetical protein